MHFYYLHIYIKFQQKIYTILLRLGVGKPGYMDLLVGENFFVFVGVACSNAHFSPIQIKGEIVRCRLCKVYVVLFYLLYI